MYVDAIEIARGYTRPLFTVFRNYQSDTIQRGASTLFFINSDGWVLTCKHVASIIIQGEELRKRNNQFIKAINEIPQERNRKRATQELEKKFNISQSLVYEIKNNFVNCVDGPLNFQIFLHPKLDIALIHFNNFSKLLCNSFPKFAKDGLALKPGKSLCRMGFPFAEFTNYELDQAKSSIVWSQKGKQNTPFFPIEGMVTRGLMDEQDVMVGFEMSTPGLKGQSGGPVFDTKGVIWGMQSGTAHLDLDFDIDQKVLRLGKLKSVKDSAFLHVGICLHIDVIKTFMIEHNVIFEEE